MSKPRVVVLTGGGSGMGKVTAEKFADNGDIVYILGRTKKKLEEVAAYSKSINPLVTDITDTKNVESARDQIVKAHKKIDVLINCAGGNKKIAPDATDTEVHQIFSDIVDLNLKGTFNVIYAFLPNMTRPGGRIINITSLAGLAGSRQGGVNGQAYAAAKAGVHGLTYTLARDLGKDGITVNCIAPGLIGDTDFFGGNPIPDHIREAYMPNIPLKRLGTPQDIAAGVFYLASEEASYVTGEILNINGGVLFGR